MALICAHSDLQIAAIAELKQTKKKIKWRRIVWMFVGLGARIDDCRPDANPRLTKHFDSPFVV